MRPREPKPWRWIPWAVVAVVVLTGLSACKGRKKKPARPRNACSATSLKETRRWLADLCAAHAQKLDTPNHHWWGLPLARADVKLAKKLPVGVLLTLTPTKLLIDGKPAPDWPKPAAWVVPSMALGTGPVITRLLPRLRRTLGASASISSAKSALDDLERRATAGVGSPRARPPRGFESTRDKDLPSGLTVLTLITAKQHLTGRGPRWVHLAIGPKVHVRKVVQLQTLLALAGFDGVHLLFRPRSAPDAPLPPAPRVYEAFGDIGPVGDSRTRRAARRRALRLEEQRWEQQGCDAMTRLRATLAKASPGQRCQLVQDRLPDAIRRCECPLDERPLLSLWLAVLSPMDHVGTKTVRLYPRGKRIEARPNAIWSEIADGVVAKPGHHLWIVITN